MFENTENKQLDWRIRHSHFVSTLFHSLVRWWRPRRIRPQITRLSQLENPAMGTKNKLYIASVKQKCVTNELRYKDYRNKLNPVLRSAERKFLAALLDKNKSNLQKICRVLEGIVNCYIWSKYYQYPL